MTYEKIVFAKPAVFLKQNTLRKYPLDTFKLYTIVGYFCSQCKPVISLGYQDWDPSQKTYHNIGLHSCLSLKGIQLQH